MITLTVSKDRICLFDWKREKLFRASLTRNCLAPTLDYIVMQMRKTNREKGYWVVIRRSHTDNKYHPGSPRITDFRFFRVSLRNLKHRWPSTQKWTFTVTAHKLYSELPEVLKGHRQPVSFARLCCCYYPDNRIGRFASETSREEELLRIRCSICFLIQTPSSFRSIISRLK